MSLGNMMLNLKIGDHFTLGEDIRVELVEKLGTHTVRVKVTAPKSVRIEYSSRISRRRKEHGETI